MKMGKKKQQQNYQILSCFMNLQLSSNFGKFKVTLRWKPVTALKMNILHSNCNNRILNLVLFSFLLCKFSIKTIFTRLQIDHVIPHASQFLHRHIWKRMYL